VVNSAFSKAISICHIEGGGKFNLKRKTFWQKARKPKHKIVLTDNSELMIVDDNLVNIELWLKEHEHEWLSDWCCLNKHIALCGKGNFHWHGDSPIIAYRHNSKYLKYVEWKKEYYIRPAYQLLKNNSTLQWLYSVWKIYKRPLGLVHPKGRAQTAEEPLTKEYITQLYNNPHYMACMPYVVAGFLLGVPC
jgi:hypothetical protein